MLFILAPSKTMDFRQADIKGSTTKPRFQAQAEELVKVIRNHEDLAKFMHISSSLALAVAQKYQQWGKVVQPAVYSYVGDVYKGFYAKTLSKSDVAWAQKHLRIMSGLYGIVRPLDEISAYRLEMKARLEINECKNIYDFWGDKLARQADEEAGGIICILSSDEYARPITRFTKSTVVTPVFLDKKPDGTIGTVPIYSKMMRGVMARWVIDHRVDNPDQLRKFRGQGYVFSETMSTLGQPAFYRETPKPIVYKK